MLLNINLCRSKWVHPFFDSSHGSNLWDSQAGAQVLITCRDRAAENAAEPLRDVAVLTCLGVVCCCSGEGLVVYGCTRWRHKSIRWIHLLYVAWGRFFLFFVCLGGHLISFFLFFPYLLCSPRHHQSLIFSVILGLPFQKQSLGKDFFFFGGRWNGRSWFWFLILTAIKPRMQLTRLELDAKRFF